MLSSDAVYVQETVYFSAGFNFFAKRQKTISVNLLQFISFYPGCRLSLPLRPKCAAPGIFCRQKHTHLFTVVMHVLDLFTLWPGQNCRARGDFSSGGVDSATWQTESESELFPLWCLGRAQSLALGGAAHCVCTTEGCWQGNSNLLELLALVIGVRLDPIMPLKIEDGLRP